MFDNQNEQTYIMDNEQSTDSQTEASFDYSSETLVDELLTKNQEQSTNLTNQRQIIKDAYDENAKLREQIAAMRNELEEFKKAQSAYGLDKNTLDEFNLMKSQLQDMAVQRKREALVPVLNTMRDMGVPQQNVQAVFNEVKRIYGVDLTQNPNANLMRIAIQEQGWGASPDTSYQLPRGGYQYADYQQRAEQQRQANYNNKVQAKLAELEAYAQAQRQKNKI